MRGNKSVNGEIYDNVCYWFAAPGLMAIKVDYRLADIAPYPGGAEDMRDALDLVVRKADSWRIDPEKLFLIGHPAGGAHAATCLFFQGIACASTSPNSRRTRVDQHPARRRRTFGAIRMPIRSAPISGMTNDYTKHAPP